MVSSPAPALGATHGATLWSWSRITAVCGNTWRTLFLPGVVVALMVFAATLVTKCPCRFGATSLPVCTKNFPTPFSFWKASVADGKTRKTSSPKAACNGPTRSSFRSIAATTLQGTSTMHCSKVRALARSYIIAKRTITRVLPNAADNGR